MYSPQPNQTRPDSLQLCAVEMTNESTFCCWWNFHIGHRYCCSPGPDPTYLHTGCHPKSPRPGDFRDVIRTSLWALEGALSEHLSGREGGVAFRTPLLLHQILLLGRCPIQSQAHRWQDPACLPSTEVLGIPAGGIWGPWAPGVWCLAKARDPKALISSIHNMGKKGALWKLIWGTPNFGVTRGGFLGFVMTGLSSTERKLD